MMDDLVQRLRACADDPMWAHHAEVPKTLCARAADEIERLRADAERYRWLRAESDKKHDFYSDAESWMVSRQQGGMGQNFFGYGIDAAIDAAIRKE